MRLSVSWLAAGGRLMELYPDECWSLVGACDLGRIAWMGPTAPSVLPVNYALDGQDLLVRTGAYSSIAREIGGGRVALEVDDIDPSTRAGWSVLLRGTASLDFDAVAHGLPEPWPEGLRLLVVRIAVTEVTGRRLLPS